MPRFKRLNISEYILYRALNIKSVLAAIVTKIASVWATAAGGNDVREEIPAFINFAVSRGDNLISSKIFHVMVDPLKPALCRVLYDAPVWYSSYGRRRISSISTTSAVITIRAPDTKIIV
jgi:hypothetical protein